MTRNLGHLNTMENFESRISLKSLHIIDLVEAVDLAHLEDGNRGFVSLDKL